MTVPSKNCPPAIPSAEDPFVTVVGGNAARLLAGLSGKRLILAFSGGPDSTALLAAVLAYRSSQKFVLVALHINHGLRGAESDEDEAFCQRLCRAWQVDLIVERLSVCNSDEESLRDARYALFAEHANRLQADAVLTGHNLDDQAETVLFRLFRGTGPAGLAGMQSIRSLADTESTQLVRPLLGTRRSEITEFLSRHYLPSRFDSSNAGELYSRNYIRNVIVPHIEKRFPGFSGRIEQLSNLIQQDEQFLTALRELARKQISNSSNERSPDLSPESWVLNEFTKTPLSLQRRLVVDALNKRFIEANFQRVQSVIALASGGTGVLSLNEQWEISVADELITWRTRLREVDESERTPMETLSLVIPGTTLVPQLNACLIITEVESSLPQQFPPAESGEVLVDLSRVEGELFLRTRREGDRIQPFGMNEVVRLKKYLHTHKGSCLLNHGGAVLVADSQEVLWVPGVGMSERLRVNGRATHRLKIAHLSMSDGYS